MWFSVRTNVPFLFKQWSLSTTSGFEIALLTTAAIAVIYEGLNLCFHTKRSLLQTDNKRYRFQKRIESHCLLTVFHILRLVLGYVLMLCVMTYNIWLLVAVIVGTCTGYLFSRLLFNACIIRCKMSTDETADDRSCLLPRNGEGRTYGTI